MPDNFVEACKTQLKIDSATVRNVVNIKRNKMIAIKKFSTSSSSCSKIAVTGAKDETITFDVVLSEEEDIEDVIDTGDEVTVQELYYLPDGTLYKTVSLPVVIANMSDDVDITEGGEIRMTVECTSNGAETIT